MADATAPTEKTLLLTEGDSAPRYEQAIAVVTEVGAIEDVVRMRRGRRSCTGCWATKRRGRTSAR